MPPLESAARRKLESVVIQARDVAEAAARSALLNRAVAVAEPFAHFGPTEKALRNRLRARGRQAGDLRNPDKTQPIDQLSQELAYEYWHRMLFARFLAENHLLMHPDGVAVSLEECEELASDAKPPASNGFVLAARYASTMLPRIFRTDDVLLEIEFAPEQRLALEKLLASIPAETFRADDGLGWVYQFWQSKKKEEVNKSGAKIDGRTLSAVTQLFTEHYMVEFLLHNTLGAWWCGLRGTQGPPGGAGVPKGQSPVGLEYLRWRDDGSPAAGTFPGWPRSLAEFTMLDPCCGSGHFLVAAFQLLVPLRMHDEGLTAAQACEAVLRDNLFGLELDPRCTQIAAFALALAAWKYPDAGGYRTLPALNIACSGQGVVGSRNDWTRFANGDGRFREGMERLYDLYQKAPTLGSLIDPRTETGDLFALGFDTLRGTVERTFKRLEAESDPDRAAMGVAAQGIATAASLMARHFTLVATNVPYLARGKHDETLRTYLVEKHSTAKADLATAFVERCLEYCHEGGSTALVTPQNWLFLGSYKGLREWMLKQVTWNVVAKLGPGAFETISGEVVNVALLIHTAAKPDEGHELVGLDASESRGSGEKESSLADGRVRIFAQSQQLRVPDARIVFEEGKQLTYLDDYALCKLGLGTGDLNHYLRQFWEIPCVDRKWSLYQTTAKTDSLVSGYDSVVAWDFDQNKVRGMTMAERKQAHNQDCRGREVWGKKGVTVSLVAPLKVTLFSGERFDKGLAAVLPLRPAQSNAVYTFVRSREFAEAVAAVDQQLKVTNSSLLKVPFDLERWQKVAAEEYPNGLPEPHSDDPTQWLFKGDVATSTDPLQVAVARLLGYRWPEQDLTSAVGTRVAGLEDRDGIVCVSAVRNEPPAAERLLELLRAAHGERWSPSTLHGLLTTAGCKAGASLDEWLRDLFFDQHCKRFHQRPFLWHIWDGRKDGFAALVNYHKLDHQALENLTYSYLGDWITAQSRSTSAGADLRLAAAQALQHKLKLILAGEPPYDIFVRWKPLHEQAIGWNPDLNDGVRMNIRPFVEAGVLRKPPNIKWTKDRGKEPTRDQSDYPWFWTAGAFTGDRVNDVHPTHAEKRAAREKPRG